MALIRAFPAWWRLASLGWFAALGWGLLEASLFIAVWQLADRLDAGDRPRPAAGVAVALPLALFWIQSLAPMPVPLGVWIIAPLLTWLWLGNRWGALSTLVTAALASGPLPPPTSIWAPAALVLLSGSLAAVTRPLLRRATMPGTLAVYTCLALGVLGLGLLQGSAAVVTTTAVLAAVGAYGAARAARGRRWAELRQHAAIDQLTGALTRYGWRNWVRELSPPQATGLVAAVDLDDFKQYNDTFGHAVGDHLLAEAVRRMRSVLRTSDVIVRSGGDEFSLWMPGLRAEYGHQVAERVRQAVSATPVAVGGRQLALACSVGWATGPLNWDTLTLADQALLQAKRQGKNQALGSAGPDAEATALARQAEGFWQDWPVPALLTDRRGRPLAANPAAVSAHLAEPLEQPPVDSPPIPRQRVREWRHADGRPGWMVEVVYPLYPHRTTVGYWVERRPLAAPPTPAAAVDWSAWRVFAVFQPLMEIATGRPFAYEALARPRFQQQVVSPETFFELAQAMDDLATADRLCLEAVAAALRTGASWPERARLALNVRSDTLAQPHWLRRFLESLPVPLDRIVLEVAECDRVPAPYADWRALREAYPEVAFALDDWGKGWHDIRRLSDLAPEWVKVDRSWLAAAQSHGRARTLLDSLVGWADRNGVILIAEGVESPADLALLREAGIRWGQGLYWQAPRPWRARAIAARRSGSSA